MKRFTLFFGLLLIAAMINAQVPQGFKYQTVARNNAGEILASQNISFRMTILQGALPGTAVYAETHTATTNATGLVTLEIGRGTQVSGSFAAINWSTTPVFLKTEIDPAGGTAYVEMGTSELLSVPFSLYAKTAGNGFSGNYNDLTNKPALWDSTWLTIKNKPTTVAGYGITNAMTTAHAANGITSGNISNWNTAFGWGNHAGLYRPISYVPNWNEITNKPAGQNPGDMLYWNGTQWIPVPVGSNNQILKLNNTVPSWSSLKQLPTILTTAITGITDVAAISGGNVSDGGDPVTEKGVCWSTSPNPTIANTKTNDGIGSGAYTSNITGLLPATTYYLRAFATNSIGTGYGNELIFTTISWICGDPFTINHLASGGVAPVDKSVTYGTVTNIPGATTKCWITRNLGASQQATASWDATEASAGWYWQFNKKQGYKHDGTNRTPNTTWISSISEALDWALASDPCSIELGTGWRIPTGTEWTNVDASGNWTNWNGPWNSNLKMHAAGNLRANNALLEDQGVEGFYWSNTQYNATNSWYLRFSSSSSAMGSSYYFYIKAHGFSLRCLKD